MHRQTGTVTGAAVAAVLLAGCAGVAEPGQSVEPSTAAPATSVAPSPDPSLSWTASPAAPGGDEDADAPVAFPDVAAVQTQDPSGDARLTVTDVRVGTHDGYDRVVFELAGTGTPGWWVEYVAQAVDDPSDQPVDLQGDAALQVMLLGMGYPADTGETEWSGDPLTPGYPALRDVDLRGTFEAQTQAFLGVTPSGTPFRVFALSDPTRVVVDVRHG
jgi:hypothetical protein